LIEQHEIAVSTRGRGNYELTREIQQVVRDSGFRVGLCNVFIRHTSASLMICENADPDVLRDMETFMSGLVPDGDPMFVHTAEGPDDMPAHVRSVLTQTALTIPIRDGQCALGTWQGVYLWEHRSRGHSRKVLLTLQGD